MSGRAAGKQIGLSVAMIVILVLSSSGSSSAADPFGPRVCLPGGGAGQCSIPRGIATSPIDGQVFVVDQENRRVNEFSAWGEFIKAWGRGVDDGSAELQTCTTESGCQSGLPGSGVGQLDTPQGIAVDSEGDVYVVDLGNHRVQKYDPDGNFLLMFGGGVDQGPNNPGDVCTAPFVTAGDVCGAGSIGSDPGEFGNWGIGSYIAIGPTDEVYVGDEERIQIFDTEGIYQGELPLPQPGTVGSLAVDPNSGDLYMAYPNSPLDFEPASPDVFRLNEVVGTNIGTLQVDKPSAIATSSQGTIFVFDQHVFNGNPGDPSNHEGRILEFDAGGTQLGVFGDNEYDSSTGLATGSVCTTVGQVQVYADNANFNLGKGAFLQAYGPAPDPALCPPPQVPPSIDAQFASLVGTGTASLRAQINPHYFTPPVGNTKFYVEWAAAVCVQSEGWDVGCVESTPAPPGNSIGSAPGNVDVTTAPISLGGLSPATTYVYRFVAEGSGASGEPVVGVGGEPGQEGEEGTFTTLPVVTLPDPCPNDALRTGAAARLPDCRAYELVSPLDKDGGDAQPRLNIVPFEARMDQASTSGDSLAFSAYRAFDDPQSAPFSSQYLARRSSSGWETEAISPPQEGEAFISPLIQVDNLYRAFSPDLQTAWLQSDTEPVLGPGGLSGHPNIYRRENSAGTYQACTTAAPLLSEEDTKAPQLQGFSADGHLAVFRVENKLTANASDQLRPGGSRPIYQLYACSFEGATAKLSLLSLLPDNTASRLENTIGGPANEQFQLNQGRAESLENAVSADGSKVFWTATSGLDGANPGAVYVRINPAAEATDDICTVASTKGCTILISSGPARFWTAAEDGSIALFTTSSGQLSEYEVATDETRAVAPEVIGLLGASEDAARVYFLSRASIGGEGTAGEPNLYLFERGGETSFIATLGGEDLSLNDQAPGPVNPEPAHHTARVTPDGSTVAFMSSDRELAEEVAGYENIDQASGKPAAEIYRFQIGGEIACVSCNRTGQRPEGREIQNKYLQNSPTRPAAALLSPWLNSLYAPRVLSPDGSRIFFEGFEALLPSDTNGKADVYQWEQAGTGSCNQDDSNYVAASGGCVELISSGKSPTDSQFIDASPSGDDVFIRTAASLVGWDSGQIDIYDARVGGGFPQPPSPPEPCRGEACQKPAAPPPPPSSATSENGPGNPPPPKVKRCRKGTHKVKKKGRVRCVKNRRHKAHKSRRAGR